VKALVLNYGVGNLFSIANSLKRTGFSVTIASELMENSDLVVLPGVGTFKAVAKFLNDRAELFNKLLETGMAFLGICLGMHVMFEYGFEGGVTSKGLGWFRGYVDRLKVSAKLPHIGWDKIMYTGNAICSEFQEVNGAYMYFIHSYVAYGYDANVVCFMSRYGEAEFPAMIARDRVIATQFHPEKSGSNGMLFFKTLLRWLRK
jgi:glutamine amidotransferase